MINISRRDQWDITQDPDTLLSAKMVKLNRQLRKKQFIQAIEEPLNKVQESDKTNFKHQKDYSTQIVKTNKTDFLKSTKETLPPSIDNYSKQKYTNDKNELKISGQRREKCTQRKIKEEKNNEMRLFEIHHREGGRRQHIAEIKDFNIKQYSGQAILIVPNSKKYEGQWVDGVLMGNVKITYPNGDIYLGPLYNYKKHGRGILHYASGEKYQGEFSFGDFHGEGCFFDKQGKIVYDGEWRRGKRHDI